MTVAPRTQADYRPREVEAARRVLVDLGQVLGSWFADAIVVVGGWVPDLLMADADEPHVGSIDVDLALDAPRLRAGRYAEIVEALLATKRYKKTREAFKLRTRVDLDDGEPAVVVDVDFMKAPERRRKGRTPRLVPGFRPFDADGCAAAFVSPRRIPIAGRTIAGAENRVQVKVASLESFLVMKAYALAGRDKPKDAYDLCYCLDNVPGGIDVLAGAWRARREDPLFQVALAHLKDKFATVTSYGPLQVATFYDAPTREEREADARRAFELVSRFIRLVERTAA